MSWWFLGDMDPVDLMIFAWLRERMAPKMIKHLGVSDAYLEQLGISVPESYAIAMKGSERQAVPVLENVFLDFRETIGPNSARLLDRGRKFEIEAVVSTLGSPERILLPVLTSARDRREP